MPGFFSSTGGPSITFPKVGHRAGGTIYAEYTEAQSTDFATGKPKVDSLDRPVLMACVPIQTDDRDPSIPGDDGKRTLYVEKVGMTIAISKAIQAAGAPDLEVGAQLWVTWTGETPSSKGNPLKTWAAEYTRPAGLLGKTNGSAAPASPAVGDDLVAAARAAQEKQQREHAEMAARAAAKIPAQGQANTTNGDTAQATADLLKIRELAKLGFEAPQIVAAMPQYTHDAIAAILAI